MSNIKRLECKTELISAGFLILLNEKSGSFALNKTEVTVDFKGVDYDQLLPCILANVFSPFHLVDR